MKKRVKSYENQEILHGETVKIFSAKFLNRRINENASEAPQRKISRYYYRQMDKSREIPGILSDDDRYLISI